MSKTEQELHDRDASRDIGAELLQSIAQMKAGQYARKTTFSPQTDGSVLREVFDASGKRTAHDVLTGARWQIAAARLASGMSQAQYAQAAGISVRTLQQWEQGRSQPTGAALALVRLLAKRPELLHELNV